MRLLSAALAATVIFSVTVYAQDSESSVDLNSGPDQAENSSSCFKNAFLDAVEISAGLLISIPVKHHSDPWKYHGVRSTLGKGNPFAFDLEAGINRTGEYKGWEAAGTLRLPCPIGVDLFCQDVKPGEGKSDFFLLYAGLPVQFIFDSRISAEIGGGFSAVAVYDENARVGGYVQLRGRLNFHGGGAVAADYRLAWLNCRPLHRMAGRLCWCQAPFSLWGGYTVLRNCRGDLLHGPGAGLGIFF